MVIVRKASGRLSVVVLAEEVVMDNRPRYCLLAYLDIDLVWLEIADLEGDSILNLKCGRSRLIRESSKAKVHEVKLKISRAACDSAIECSPFTPR